jgi:hypothetical protein
MRYLNLLEFPEVRELETKIPAFQSDKFPVFSLLKTEMEI